MNRITSCTLSPEMREEAVAKLALRKGIMSVGFAFADLFLLWTVV